MVLQALTRSSQDDNSASGRTLPLQNSRITSFFTPLTSSKASISSSLLSVAAGAVNVGHQTDSRGGTQQLASNDQLDDTKELTVTQSLKLRNGELLELPCGNVTSKASGSGSNTPQSIGTADPVKPSKETRTLRSKEKTSHKSELAFYFPNYEDIITDKPPPSDSLGADILIYIVDEPLKASSTPPAKSKTISVPTRPKPPTMPQEQDHDESQAHLHDAKTVFFDPTADTSLEMADPLSDSMFLIHHKRAERREKQLRNIEREKAQHEKSHLERILEGLEGPDWLRVLGVVGITEGEHKNWKSKRDYFIREVRELVDKFQRWRDAEREMKLEKERAREQEEDEDEGDQSDASSGASSDLDASAAMQLLQEAGLTPKPARRRQIHILYEAPPSPELPFTGFYKDAHLRAQALGETRHGRKVMAFGLPLPDPEEEEFTLYEDWTTHDSRRARDSKRRKLKKEPKARREFV